MKYKPNLYFHATFRNYLKVFAQPLFETDLGQLFRLEWLLCVCDPWALNCSHNSLNVNIY